MNRTMQFKARIKNIAQSYQISAQAVLQDFMLERLLDRISHSKYREQFIIKGGVLISSLVGIQLRTTMDLDTTIRAYPMTEDAIQKALSEICAMGLKDDVFFSLERIEPIREDDEYGGMRASLVARFESLRIPLKIDITTGDHLTPGPVLYSYHSSFEESTLEVWAYNIETILAEKVETILRRGLLNTRLRDFYDTYILMNNCSDQIRPLVFRQAFLSTVEHRGSESEISDPGKILRSISNDRLIQERWDRYCQEYAYTRNIPFQVIMDNLVNVCEWING